MEITHEDVQISFSTSEDIDFNNLPATRFLEGLYSYLYGMIDFNSGIFQIDFDNLDKNRIEQLIDSCNTRQELRRLNGKIVSNADWARDKTGKAFLLFFASFPNFSLMIKNLHADVELNIANAETLLGETVNTQNFLTIKREIDLINRLRWGRDQNNNEKQAGVSILGSISEKLIEVAMEALIDETKFFRSQHQDVQSYGDFVLMCLPNNLWLSVKSNYARERLLASGFTSDIIGVGFFTDYREFTSRSKIRNFIKVGFLAMYIPDIPITEDQIGRDVSTYQEVQDHYQNNEMTLPANINGKPFLRPLSQLYSDLHALLEIEETSRRTIVNY